MTHSFILTRVLPVLLCCCSAILGQAAPGWREVHDQWHESEALSGADLKRRAEGGDAVAKYFYYLRTIREQPKDPARFKLVRGWLEDASNAGVPQAIYDHGRSFYSSDPDKYYTLLQRAAETGLPIAQFKLAEEHLEGRRAPVDEAKAVRLLQQAADAEHAPAMTLLARLYASGFGEPRHAGETPFELFRNAAMLGDMDAGLEVARRYRHGFGTEQDLLQAARWYWRAREHNRYETPPLLAHNFEPNETGDAETKLFCAFYSLYVKAQVQHDPVIMRKVGQAFLDGQYGAANPFTGYLWLSYASRRGDSEAAELLPRAKAKLNADQISRADQEVNEMMLTQPTGARNGNRQ